MFIFSLSGLTLSKLNILSSIIKDNIKIKKDNMKQTINEFDFKNEFKKIRPQNFSYDGLTVLYDHLIQYEEDTDQELEFDPIAYCCEYTEFDSFKDVQLNYDVKTIEELEDKTTVLKIPNSEKLIIQNY
tara:strand:- start:232 stop:618 length:387 start_codon:yes stop_codon:yes gene_type:complete